MAGTWRGKIVASRCLPTPERQRVNPCRCPVDMNQPAFEVNDAMKSLCLILLCPLFLLSAKAETVYKKDMAYALSEIKTHAGRFFELKGIDWDAVTREMMADAKSVKSDQDHYILLWRLLARVKDGHASVKTTDLTKNIRWIDEKPKGGMGMFWTKIGSDIYVKNAFSVAKDAGVTPGMQVLSIDGVKVNDWLNRQIAETRDLWSFSTDHQAFFYITHWGLRAEKGSSIKVNLKNTDGEPFTADIRISDTRQVPGGPAFMPEPAAGGKYAGDSNLHWCRLADGYGYIHVRRCKGNLPEHMDEALADLSDAPGLIIDWRGNSGGGFDHDALFGRFIPEGKVTRFGKAYRSLGPNPYGGPIVTIVDATCRSAGETGSGIFKEDGRSYLIGESPTAGMSSSKKYIELPSGKFILRVSVFSNMARFNDGKGLEGVGVIPHETVVFRPRDLSEQQDTLIIRAVELLKNGFPKSVVPYLPADFGWEE